MSLWIVGVFHIAIGRVGSQILTGFTFLLHNGTDFLTAVLDIELVRQPRIKNDALCFDISDEIVVDVNVPFLMIVHGMALADLNFLNQPHQCGTV